MMGHCNYITPPTSSYIAQPVLHHPISPQPHSRPSSSSPSSPAPFPSLLPTPFLLPPYLALSIAHFMIFLSHLAESQEEADSYIHP